MRAICSADVPERSLAENLMRALVPVALFSVACGSALGQTPAAAGGPGTAPAVGIAPEPGFLGPDWQVAIGAGAILRPDYAGSDSVGFMPVPFIDIAWRDRVFLTTRAGPELGVFITRDRTFRSGIAIEYAFGRDEDANDLLKGLGDVDGSVRARLFASTGHGPFTLSAYVSQDLADNGHGLTAGADFEYRVRFAPTVAVFGGPGFTYANGEYAETFFGITDAQAARSVAGLPRFDADGGIRDVHFTLGAVAAATPSLVFLPRLTYAYLLGDAGDSPLTRSKGQFVAALVAAYRF
jgi:outer membrane protein